MSDVRCDMSNEKNGPPLHISHLTYSICHLTTKTLVLQVLLVFMLALGLASCAAASKFEQFFSDAEYGEQTWELAFEPGVRVLVNAPLDYDEGKPTRLIFYALPNGNTIEQTVGKEVKEGVDWHFGIQHIGAQTRLLRIQDTATNYIVAYLETALRSWPNWRSTTPQSEQRIRAMIDWVRGQFPLDTRVTLACHSGGGSLLWGFINGYDAIPDFVDRFLFLDANYSFSIDDGHGAKLLKWLNGDRSLIIMAYDDREIVLDGKKVIGPTGGTYRRTLEMAKFFTDSGLPMVQTEDSIFIRFRSTAPNLALAIHKNPENKILHTVLVEKNGFVEGITLFTPQENLIARLWGPIEYSPFIRPD